MIHYGAVGAKVIIYGVSSDSLLNVVEKKEKVGQQRVLDVVEYMEQNVGGKSYMALEDKRLHSALGPLYEKVKGIPGAAQRLLSDDFELRIIFEPDAQKIDKVLDFWSSEDIKESCVLMEQWLEKLKIQALEKRGGDGAPNRENVGKRRQGKKVAVVPVKSIWSLGSSASISTLTQEECVQILHYLNYKERRTGALLNYLINEMDMSNGTIDFILRSGGHVYSNFAPLYKIAGGHYKDFTDTSMFSKSMGGVTPIRVLSSGASSATGARASTGVSQTGEKTCAPEDGQWSALVLEEMRSRIRSALLQESSKEYLVRTQVGSGGGSFEPKRKSSVSKDGSFSTSDSLKNIKDMLCMYERHKPSFIQCIWVECEGVKVPAIDLLAHWQNEFGKSFVNANIKALKKQKSALEYEEQKNGVILELKKEDSARAEQEHYHFMHLPPSWCAKLYKDQGCGWREFGHVHALLDRLHVSGKSTVGAGGFSLFASTRYLPKETASGNYSPRVNFSLSGSLGLRSGQIKEQYADVVKDLEALDEHIFDVQSDHIQKWLEQKIGTPIVSLQNEQSKHNDDWMSHSQQSCRAVFEKYALEERVQKIRPDGGSHKGASPRL